MVAFHFPPYSGTSGVHRTLKYSHYLPDHGWAPIVLTSSPRAYPKISPDPDGGVARGVIVARAFALDTAQHLSVSGVYPRWLALPDRWWTWWPGAVVRGLAIIRRHRPDVLWSTYPIATAHLIALTLHRLTGIPWVADFRDPMTEADYPADVAARRCARWIEQQTLLRSQRAIFTARSTREMYLARYEWLTPASTRLIENGYDETDFSGIERASGGAARDGRCLTIVHSGVVYSDERDPRPLFRALARLKSDGIVTPDELRIVLRGPGDEGQLKRLVREQGIDDLVSVLPAVSHGQSIREGAAADALLLLQGPTCNAQIPAKTYEYLRLSKPILALTSEAGDTAARLREGGGATILDIQDETAIIRGLPDFLRALRLGTHPLPRPDTVRQWSRENQARDLAQCLNELSRRRSS